MAEGRIDHDVLDALREATGDEFLAELIETFIDEAPVMLSDLRDAAGAGDADRFRRAAHSIKSNASTFGAVDLAERARVFELGDLGALDPADLDALDQAISDAATALKGAIDG